MGVLCRFRMGNYPLTRQADMSDNSSAMEKLLYTLDERPPAWRNILYALQWLLIVLPLITVTSNIMASFLGLDIVESTALFQRFLLIVGVVTAAQCALGHRYPLIDGRFWPMTGWP